LATNEQAWQESRDLPSMTYVTFPSDAMVWATAATQGATSWGHIDDHGMATIVKVMTGRKYWVVMCPKRNQMSKNANGNMGSIHAYGDGWEPHSACEDLWDHEGVLLEAGDTL
jgi:hypothetical protein